MRNTLFALLSSSLLAALSPAQTETAAPSPSTSYDPLRLPDAKLPAPLLLDIRDDARNRTIPVRVQLPSTTTPAPVVLFSHGLGGTRDTCQYLAAHWAARGYVAVFLQHPGSDDSVWRTTKAGERMAAMKQAASGQNLLLRCGDVAAVLDTLAVWHGAADHPLAGRLDLEHTGMSGHSFGAVTTQAVAGQSMPLLGTKWTDPRIDAALPMSPSAKERNTKSFTQVKVPWLLMTGTADTSPINDTTVEDRLRVWPSLPATIDRYELVLHDAEHSAFTERGLPGERRQRNPNHHRAILAISTAFWDAHLRADPDALAWLHGEGARSVLEAEDRWQQAHPEQASVR